MIKLSDSRRARVPRVSGGTAGLRLSTGQSRRPHAPCRSRNATHSCSEWRECFGSERGARMTLTSPQSRNNTGHAGRECGLIASGKQIAHSKTGARKERSKTAGLELVGDAYLPNIQMGRRASRKHLRSAVDKIDVRRREVRSVEADVVVLKLRRPIQERYPTLHPCRRSSRLEFPNCSRDQ